MEDRLIPSNGVTIYVHKGKVAGVIAVSNHEGINWIDQLYVTPLMVGQGIGTNLLEYSLKKLSRPIRLYAFQQNMRARKFYERFGFQAIAFSDGQSNEEKCPDVLYELRDFL